MFAFLVEPPFGVDADNDTLVAERLRALVDEFGPLERAGGDRNLVRAGPERLLDILGGSDAAANCEGMKTSSATRSTTSSIVSRPSAEAVMSRKTNSSAPARLYARAISTGSPVYFRSSKLTPV